jgi:hypothetical protein
VIAPLLCCFGFAAPAGAVDLVGRTVAVFEWSAASGPVVYYYVEVNRNDEGYQPAAMLFRSDGPTEKPRTSIGGKFGESIRVRVLAVASSGEMSAFSPESETVYFVAPPPDDVDHCPDDPAKTQPGICGCGVSDRDSDADGTPDCEDSCAVDSAKTEPGICGCGVSDRDSDADGTPDCEDSCRADSAKTEPGICGCGVSDRDSDADGAPDCEDSCAADPAKTEPGICGCGVSDADSDANGSADCLDEPPAGDPAELLDFNADGRADLLIRKPATGEIALLLLAYSSVDPKVPPSSPAPHMKIVGNADYDGDGYADLLLHDPATGRLEIRLLETGATAETGALQIAVSQDVVGSADYDGNGYADLLLRDRTTDDLQFWSLYGTEVLEIVPLPSAGAEILGSGDYDGDGRHDILWRDGSHLFVWYLDDPANPEEETLPGIPVGYRVVGTGDYDGDGTSDVLLGNARDFKMYLFRSQDVSAYDVRKNGLIPGGILGKWDPGDYRVVGNADFDGDGFCDIALRHEDGELMLLYMRGPNALRRLLLGLRQVWSVAGVGLENPAND